MILEGSPATRGRILLRPESVAITSGDGTGAVPVESCFASGAGWTVRTRVGNDILEGRAARRVEVGSKVEVQLPPSVWVV